MECGGERGIRTPGTLSVQWFSSLLLSGHLTSSVFRRYDIVSEADLFNAARKLDAAAGLPSQAQQTGS